MCVSPIDECKDTSRKFNRDEKGVCKNSGRCRKGKRKRMEEEEDWLEEFWGVTKLTVLPRGDTQLERKAGRETQTRRRESRGESQR